MNYCFKVYIPNDYLEDINWLEGRWQFAKRILQQDCERAMIPFDWRYLECVCEASKEFVCIAVIYNLDKIIYQAEQRKMTGSS